METYKIPLVPGPTSVPAEYREAYMTDYGSTDLEEEFFELLAENQNLLKKNAPHSERRDNRLRRGNARALGSDEERHKAGR